MRRADIDRFVRDEERITELEAWRKRKLAEDFLNSHRGVTRDGVPYGARWQATQADMTRLEGDVAKLQGEVKALQRALSETRELLLDHHEKLLINDSGVVGGMTKVSRLDIARGITKDGEAILAVRVPSEAGTEYHVSGIRDYDE